MFSICVSWDRFPKSWIIMMTFYSSCSVLQDCFPKDVQISIFCNSSNLISKNWLFITLIICRVACFSNVCWSFLSLFRQIVFSYSLTQFQSEICLFSFSFFLALSHGMQDSNSLSSYWTTPPLLELGNFNHLITSKSQKFIF